MTILYFIIALGVLIFIHELGHFIIAKRAGVYVEVFSLGFGPRILGFRKGETLYQVSLLPLGGYVKMKGEDPSSEEAADPRSFSQKSLKARFAVVFAGPLMNLLLALLIMPVVFMMGRPVPAYLDKAPVVQGVLVDSPAEKLGLQSGDKILTVAGEETSTWSDLMRAVLLRPDSEVVVEWDRQGKLVAETVRIRTRGKANTAYLGVEPPHLAAESTRIDDVTPNGPAASASLQAGDEVVAINNEPISSWSKMSERVQDSKGEALTVEVKRGGETVVVTLKPEFNEGMERYLLGIQKSAGIGESVIRKYPFGEAIIEGTKENLRLVGLTFRVVGRLITFQLSYKSLGGPIRIAQASASAAQSGVAAFLFFMAFLSVQLGILNLLPIPVLDGGHLFFMGIEAIRRKPVSQRVQGIAIQVGLFVLLFLMLIVTVNDIDMVWGFREMFDKVRSIFSAS